MAQFFSTECAQHETKLDEFQKEAHAEHWRVMQRVEAQCQNELASMQHSHADAINSMANDAQHTVLAENLHLKTQFQEVSQECFLEQEVASRTVALLRVRDGEHEARAEHLQSDLDAVTEMAHRFQKEVNDMQMDSSLATILQF